MITSHREESLHKVIGQFCLRATVELLVFLIRGLLVNPSMVWSTSLRGVKSWQRVRYLLWSIDESCRKRLYWLAVRPEDCTLISYKKSPLQWGAWRKEGGSCNAFLASLSIGSDSCMDSSWNGKQSYEWLRVLGWERCMLQVVETTISYERIWSLSASALRELETWIRVGLSFLS